jgi:hypothetical protein
MAEGIGYAMLGIGILVMLGTLAMGYGVYTSANAEAAAGTLPATNANYSTVNAALGGIVGGVVSNMRYAIYSGLEIMALFLFGSIGYKFAYLGILEIRQKNGPDK